MVAGDVAIVFVVDFSAVDAFDHSFKNIILRKHKGVAVVRPQ